MTPRADAPTVPLIHLDPTGADHHGEAARLRAAGRTTGGVVRVMLPGEVPAWALTTHALVDWLVKHPGISKDYRDWTAVRTGVLTDDNPIVGMIKVENLVTANGEDHQRLRRPLTAAFTHRRVQNLAPRMTAIAAGLLDALPEHADASGVVDLRAHFATKLPLRVICELLGVPDEQQRELRTLVDSIFRTDTTAEQVMAVQAGIPRLLDQLVELRTRQPGDDLTSALIATRTGNPDALSDDELRGTLWVLLTAGHETTIGLITNAVRALLTHPDQLRQVLTADRDRWDDVVEETLRWDSSIGNFPARYPLEDLTVSTPEGEFVIPAGDAILAPYTAVGRDPQQHGEDAHLFDINRDQKGDLAFGGGRHICPGSHLALLEARSALPALFDRYPDLRLSVAPEDLPAVPSLFTNSAAALPVEGVR